MIEKIYGALGVGGIWALCALALAVVVAAIRNADTTRAIERHLTVPLRAVITSKEHLGTLISIVTNTMFLGPAAAGLAFGFTAESREAYLLGFLLALLCAWLLVRLSRLMATLARAEGSAAHRRNAGAVRSIVRDELSSAAARNAAPGRRCRLCGAHAPHAAGRLKVGPAKPRMKGRK